MPWLITERDLLRYTYRALHACDRGRIVFFRHRDQESQTMVLMALVRYPEPPGAMMAASNSFRAGRVKRVRLEDLPAIR